MKENTGRQPNRKKKNNGNGNDTLVAIVEAVVRLMKGAGLTAWLLLVTLAVIIAGAIIWFHHANAGNGLGITTDRKIDVTPAQIESIRRIGQWEFLSISDEELIDTVDRGFISDRELARIYYGTLRLGIDLSKINEKWIQTDDSVVVAMLPAIELLDHNFIDEARTRSFFESGKWTDRDREQLYKKAHNKMLSRCMTPANMENAESNARTQFTQLLNAMGFKNVRIEFEGKTK